MRRKRGWTIAFKRINVENWERKEYYQHFTQEVVCSYSITVNLDITNLKGQQLYPAMLWLLTDTVNDYEAFRTQETAGGVGVFDTMHPSYTIFDQERKTFSSIWTAFSPDYEEFCTRYRADVKSYQGTGRFSPKPGKPENCFDVSMLPWAHFTGFNLNVHNGGHYLLPIFTMGKAIQREGRTLLPLALQAHHAVCDGYHASVFLDSLQGKIDTF